MRRGEEEISRGRAGDSTGSRYPNRCRGVRHCSGEFGCRYSDYYGRSCKCSGDFRCSFSNNPSKTSKLLLFNCLKSLLQPHQLRHLPKRLLRQNKSNRTRVHHSLPMRLPRLSSHRPLHQWPNLSQISQLMSRKRLRLLLRSHHLSNQSHDLLTQRLLRTRQQPIVHQTC
jgi:hypothetical protein